ncbi:MAG: hypothetical protein QM791_12065 [Ferruginibacter sp.]
MIRKLVYLPLFLAFWAFSCKKDDSGNPPPTPPETTSYLKIEKNNKWDYEIVNNPSTSPSTSTYSLTCTETDTSIGGRSYRIFTRTDALGKEYYYVNGNDYYEFLSLPLLDGFKFENLFLKSGANVGDKWTQTIPPITYSGITANLSKADTIKEKGLTKVVKGVTYTDVIHVSSGIKIESMSLPIPGLTLTSAIHNYYAPKVGRIYASYDIKFAVPAPFSITQSYENKTELISTNF